MLSFSRRPGPGHGNPAAGGLESSRMPNRPSDTDAPGGAAADRGRLTPAGVLVALTVLTAAAAALPRTRLELAAPGRLGLRPVSLAAAQAVTDVTSSALVTPGPAGGPTRRPLAAVRALDLLVADSELVYGPTLYGFDVERFVTEQGGYLSSYTEDVDGVEMTGAAIVEQVAQDFSVGPRVLLALIQAHSGWVTRPNPDVGTPLAQPVASLRDALLLTADQLNTGYYGHKLDDLRTVALADGAVLELPDVNSGTFAVLATTWRDDTTASWGGMVASSRFHNAWVELFGDPYRSVGSAVVPEDLRYVPLELPIDEGQVWYFTGGPHAPWGAGAARAAIDLSPPPAGATGCYFTGARVLAAAAGKVVRSEASGVVVDPDLDRDGYAGTGWVHVYGHVAASGRVPVGTVLAAGDPIGGPSCEGGVPSQTRVSFARRYNGEWIPVDHPRAPLLLGGWSVLPGDRPGTGFMIASGIEPRTASAVKSDGVNGIARLPGGG